MSACPHIPGVNERIVQLTGVTFGDGYRAALADGNVVLGSADAATGLVALRSQPGVNALDAAAAMQCAWYRDGRSLSAAGVYRELAAELSLDAEANAAVTPPRSPTSRQRPRRTPHGPPVLSLRTRHRAQPVHRIAAVKALAEELGTAPDDIGPRIATALAFLEAGMPTLRGRCVSA